MQDIVAADGIDLRDIQVAAASANQVVNARYVPYFPHRDYQIYTPDGRRLQRVWNSQSHEDETPTIVNLPVGRYEVGADAEFYGLVRMPVQIRANELTKVVLQPDWKPKRPFSSDELVSMPYGARSEMAAHALRFR